MIPTSRTIERHIRFGDRGSGVEAGSTPDRIDVPKGRIPHVAKLMALAIRLDDLVRSGTITTFADLARLGQVSRARITQILNLVNLRPTFRRQSCSCQGQSAGVRGLSCAICSRSRQR